MTPIPGHQEPAMSRESVADTAEAMILKGTRSGQGNASFDPIGAEKVGHLIRTGDVSDGTLARQALEAIRPDLTDELLEHWATDPSDDEMAREFRLLARLSLGRQP